MTDSERAILSRHVGRCMEALEQLSLDPAMLRVIKGIVRNELDQLAADMIEASDGR